MAQQFGSGDIGVKCLKKSSSCSDDMKNKIQAQIVKFLMSADRKKKTMLVGLREYTMDQLKKGGIIYKGSQHLLNSGLVAMEYAITFEVNGETYTILYFKRVQQSIFYIFLFYSLFGQIWYMQCNVYNYLLKQNPKQHTQKK